MNKHRINQATTQVICQNIGNYLQSKDDVKAREIAPDATRSLIKAADEQSALGWEQWFKGRWSNEWLNLINYDINTIDSGIKFNTSEKWANEMITAVWEYVYNNWHARNSIEHDKNGDPECRKKEKVIEHILGISEKMDYKLYKQKELVDPTLIGLPI
jgi:hypothetical protein